MTDSPANDQLDNLNPDAENPVIEITFYDEKSDSPYIIQSDDNLANHTTASKYTVSIPTESDNHPATQTTASNYTVNVPTESDNHPATQTTTSNYTVNVPLKLEQDQLSPSSQCEYATCQPIIGTISPIKVEPVSQYQCPYSDCYLISNNDGTSTGDNNNNTYTNCMTEPAVKPTVICTESQSTPQNKLAVTGEGKSLASPALTTRDPMDYFQAIVSYNKMVYGDYSYPYGFHPNHPRMHHQQQVQDPIFRPFNYGPTTGHNAHQSLTTTAYHTPKTSSLGNQVYRNPSQARFMASQDQAHGVKNSVYPQPYYNQSQVSSVSSASPSIMHSVGRRLHAENERYHSMFGSGSSAKMFYSRGNSMNRKWQPYTIARRASSEN